MNPIIERIAEQSQGTRKYVPPVWQFYDIELENFVKLIAQEHLNLLKDCYRNVKNSQEWDNALKFLEDHIKEHFGIDFNE